MSRTVVETSKAPAAIGTYSQAIRHGNTVWLSGQIPLDPATMNLVNDTIEAEIHQVFSNLREVASAAGGSLADVVKVNLFLTDLSFFATVNEIMATYFPKPYPARAAVGVVSLPKGARFEAEAVMVLQG